MAVDQIHATSRDTRNLSAAIGVSGARLMKGWGPLMWKKMSCIDKLNIIDMALFGNMIHIDLLCNRVM